MSNPERYRELGFLVVEDVLSPEEVEALRRRTWEIAEGVGDDFPPENLELEPGRSERSLQTVRKINRCAESDSVFLSAARHPRILDVVESLIGRDVKLFGSQCFMKPPGGIEKPYHQDSAYFAIEPMEIVTCWIALDEVTVDNGCMWVIPGGHRLGLMEHADWAVGDRPDKQIPESQLDLSKETPILLSAGSCSFHHSLLPHRSGANRSTQARRGLAVHYMSSRSRWVHPTAPQPEYLLLRGRSYPGCV